MSVKSTSTAENLIKAKQMYFMALNPFGLKDLELAELLGVSQQTATRYRNTLGCRETYQNSYRYTLVPTQADIQYARAILERAEYWYGGREELEKRLREEGEMLEEDF